MERVFVSNPRLAITQARDPAVVYGPNASNTRILNSGDVASTSSKARRATAAELETYRENNKKQRSQGVNINPVPSFDEAKTE